MEVVGVSGPWQNLAMTRGLEATNGYNPLRIGWYDRLVSPEKPPTSSISACFRRLSRESYQPQVLQRGATGTA